MAHSLLCFAIERCSSSQIKIIAIPDAAQVKPSADQYHSEEGD